MDRDDTQDQVEATPTIGREQLLQVLLRAGVGQVPYKKPPRVCQVFLLLMLAERSALPGCGAALWGTVGSGGLLFPEHLDVASTCRKTRVRAVVGLSCWSLPRSPQPLFHRCSEPAVSDHDCSIRFPRPQELAAGFWGLPTTHVADLGWCHMTTQPGALME